MIHLTSFPAAASPAGPFAAILAYDALRPDGLTKEVVTRAAALGLLKGAGSAAGLAELHDLLDPTVAAAIAAGVGVVNPVVKRVIALDALRVPPGQSVSDATAALAGAVYDVANNKPLTVAAPPPPEPTPAAPTAGPPDLSGLDLLGPAFEPLRVVLTRTLEAVRPDLYAEYRRIKDGGAATARADAYEFAFGVLAALIEQAKGQAGA